MNFPAIATAAPRKFKGNNSREAFKLARTAFGADALVLAARSVSDGFEVVVIGEGAATELAEAATAAPAPPAPSGFGQDSVLAEVLSMRTMLEERLETIAWNEGQRRDPVRGRLMRTMLQAGFSPKLSRVLLETLGTGHTHADGLTLVAHELARALPVKEGESEALAAGGVYALVGPTGAGKTTTTAKLAARFLDSFGAENMALVTIDTFRIGASQQLQIYGQMMSVPVFVAKDKNGLAAILGQLREKRLVLIDTEGRSQRDRAVADQVAMLSGIGVPVQRLLLLDGRSHGDALNETAYAWQRAGRESELAGCIFTKLDEATATGALLDTAIRHRLAVHYLSTGQRVPEDLALPDRAKLVDAALAAPRAGALFAFDPDAAAGLSSGADADRARAEAERLRRHCARLIGAMTHDAEELAAAAKHLERCEVGFAPARRLWAAAHDEDSGPDRTLQELLALGHAQARACASHVLAVCGRAKLEPNEHGDTFDLQSCVLLSDRTGQPLAAPNQWLATGGDPKRAARQIQWLRQQDFGKPQVHLLPRAPAGDDLSRWTAPAQRWVGRVTASAAVVDRNTGASTPVAQLPFEFGEGVPTRVHGRPAFSSEAEVAVVLRGGRGEEVPVRCVARRVIDADGKDLLAPAFLLSNIGPEVAARDLAQWQEWAARVEPCFRLASKGVLLLGGIAQIGAPSMMKRLLIAGQVATTAWRVLHAGGDGAERIRQLLAQLAGRQVRPGRPHSGAAIYEGLVKLFQVLDALSVDGAEPSGSVA